jgi:hypothetical protein
MKPSGVWKSRELDVAPEIKPTLGFDLAAHGAMKHRNRSPMLISTMWTKITDDLTSGKENKGTVADALISTNLGQVVLTARRPGSQGR